MHINLGLETNGTSSNGAAQLTLANLLRFFRSPGHFEPHFPLVFCFSTNFGLFFLDPYFLALFSDFCSFFVFNLFLFSAAIEFICERIAKPN